MAVLKQEVAFIDRFCYGLEFWVAFGDGHFAGHSTIVGGVEKDVAAVAPQPADVAWLGIESAVDV